jgi:hypothetical protein
MTSIIPQHAPESHLGLRRGFEVTQTISESLGQQAKLAIFFLDGGHTLEYHLIILSGRENDRG